MKVFVNGVLDIIHNFTQFISNYFINIHKKINILPQHDVFAMLFFKILANTKEMVGSAPRSDPMIYPLPVKLREKTIKGWVDQ